MGGQMLGGGVIALVAVVLWLVYLLPSWYSRHQFDAAERNALRLNRALRVLAETSETPEEVRLELNARTALAQQRLARRVQVERDTAEAERAKAELALAREQARIEAELAKAQAKADAAHARERAEAEAAVTREQAQAEAALQRAQAESARADAAAARERAEREAAAARLAPAVRRARARRRARLLITLVGVASLALAGWGGVQLALSGAQTLLWVGGAGVVAAGMLLGRMAKVRSRATVRIAPVAVAAHRTAGTGSVQDVDLVDERQWTPRELPRPLTASTGSRAASELDVAAAREKLRRAALEESMRERAAQAAPRSIDVARVARAATRPASTLDGDAAIEAHVRNLLARRASGQ